MKRIVLATLLCVSASMALSQNTKYVEESEGFSHLLSHPDPIYPPIAKAAHVEGLVILHAYVDENGKVTKVQAISGPPMLRGAAIEGVHKWTYKPFLENGNPKAAEVIVSIPFSLGTPLATEKADAAIGQAYFPQEDLCRKSFATRDYTTAVVRCRQAAETSDRFPDEKSRSNEIRNAHEMYGQALLASQNYPGALTELHRAVTIANASLTEKDAEYASAYLSEAMGEQLTGKPLDAERDYEISERSYRRAIANLPEMTKQYQFSLARALAYHSILERQMGHPELSEKLRNDAQALDPHLFAKAGGGGV